jgi:hypothetical protein
MRRLILGGLIFALGSQASCKADAPLPLDLSVHPNHGSPHGPPAGIPPVRVFTATMDPGQEVYGGDPHPGDVSEASGSATFQVAPDGESLKYRLRVSNIENVTMAHIHVAPAETNGPVVVWLYGPAQPEEIISGPFSGVLAEGVITAEDFVGQWQWESLEDLLDRMRAGETYVNVHTLQFPEGEIRGQVAAPGPK